MPVKKDDDKGKTDRRIGARLQELRIARGMSQEDLAKEIGVSYQQAQKYEGGLNSLSPWKLTHLAEIFGVPVASFFEVPGEAPVEQAKKDTRLLLLMGRLRRIDGRNPDAFTAICDMAKALDTEAD